MKLSELKKGQRSRILKLNSTGSLKRRLMDMGVITGEEITLEKIAPLGDPLEVSVKNYKLSLRKSEAANIEVELI